MFDNQPITFIGDFDNTRENEEIHKKTLELKLNLFDEQVSIKIDVLPKMIKLSDIVPLARELSSKISNIIRTKLSDTGVTIPCRKGCDACCSYLVPLSVPEAFRLREEILDIPETGRKEILDLFLDGARRILKEKSELSNLLEINNLSDWYSDLELVCPFLSNNICSKYNNRPIACREYLVTGTELLCKPGQQGDFHKVDLPVSILECLGKLCSELEQTDIEAIMMPLALPWSEENLVRNEKTRPAPEVVEHLIKIVEESESKSYTIRHQ